MSTFLLIDSNTVFDENSVDWEKVTHVKIGEKVIQLHHTQLSGTIPFRIQHTSKVIGYISVNDCNFHIRRPKYHTTSAYSSLGPSSEFGL